MKWAKQTHGFTIVELLIVIVVIGILAAITIVSFNGVQERAKTTQAQTDLRNLTQAITVARNNTSKTLIGITNAADSRQTKATADAAIDAIAEASGINISGLKKGDPWGNWYRIDSNELELNATDCRQDTIDVLNKTALAVRIPFSQAACL